MENLNLLICSVLLSLFIMIAVCLFRISRLLGDFDELLDLLNCHLGDTIRLLRDCRS